MTTKSPEVMAERVKALLGPIAPRCASCWYGCKENASGWLFGPDGKPNPGGHYCAQHGWAIVEEYAEKLGESWTFVEVAS